MNKLVSAVVICAASALALASDWEAISFGHDVIIYVDKDSIRFSGDTAKAWVQWSYASPRDLENSYPKKTYVLIKSLNVYKCADRTHAIIQSIGYADREAQTVVDSFEINENLAHYSSVVPDTIGEEVLQSVCQKKAGSTK